MACPLGWGHSLSCGAQAGVVWAPSALGLCCCAALSLVCRRRCRALHGGTSKVNNTVVTWRREAAPMNGKVHVVWDIDMELLGTMLPAPSGVEESAQPAGPARSPTKPRLLHHASSGIAMTGEAWSKLGLVAPLELGQRVECFSETGQKWLLACVRDVHFKEEAEAGVTADVSLLRTGQPKRLRLWQLRPTLGEGELVELWSAGRWLRAVTSGPQGLQTSAVRLLPSGKLLKTVAREDLRRRFPPQAPVEVYDARAGWSAGNVASHTGAAAFEVLEGQAAVKGKLPLEVEGADLAACEALCMEFGYRGFTVVGGKAHFFSGQDELRPVKGTCSYVHGGEPCEAMEEAEVPEGCAKGQWGRVCVQAADGCKEPGAVQVLPSYLLRLSQDFKLLLAQAELHQALQELLA